MKNEVSRGTRMLCCLLFCMFAILMQLNLQSAQADLTQTPEQLPGWPIELTGAWKISDIIITDIDNNDKDEIVIGIDNAVHIIDETGANLPGWPQQAGSIRSHEITAVAVGDIDGDGDNEIIGVEEDGVYAWHFETGILVEGWPLAIYGDSEDIVLGDFDDNPLDLEIVIAVVHKYHAQELEIYVLNGDGTYVDGWPQSFDINQLYQVYLSAGNIDNIGSDELVVACHKRGYYQSSIYVFHIDGQIASGWPIQGNGPFVSPAILCNLDDDDDFEIIAATVNESHTGKIYAWKPNGASVGGWPRNYNAFYLAVGDLDSDDRPEIVAGYNNTYYHADHLAVIDHHGTELLSKTLELRNPATVGNIDNDTDSEIIIPLRHGDLHVMDIDGQDLQGFPIYFTGGIFSHQPAMGDMDGDGDIEIILLDGHERIIHAFDLNVPKSERPDWPMVRHDERRSSLWTPPQTSGFDSLGITGPLLIMENMSTQYTARAYFEDGTNEDVTMLADWRVDPSYDNYAYFAPGGVLVSNHISTLKDIIIYAEYVEGDFAQSASCKVRIRPTVQIFYVDDDAANDPGPNDPFISDPCENGTEQHPFDTIQEAVDVANENYYDIVEVADGIYTGQGNRDIDFHGKSITVRSENGPENCIINCNGTYSDPHRGFYFRNSEGPDSVLNGFTITNGYAYGQDNNRHGGGAIRCDNSSPVINNCIIKNNSAAWDGGGINNYRSAPTIINCAFLENSAIKNDGGGINNYSSSPIITNCMFINNSAYDWGGGIRNINSSNPSITNCLFSWNVSDEGGGIFNYDNSNPTILNCTFCGNSAPTGGSVIDSEEESYAIVINSIVWGNVGPEISGGEYNISYSNIEGGWEGEGNIDVDPCFVEAGLWDANGTPEDANDDFWVEGDYHLRMGSLCIDAGDPNYVPSYNETDLDGLARVFGGRIDMGAYEFSFIESQLRVLPQVINRYNRMKRIMAWVHLPEGVSKEQVDEGEGVLLYPGGIEPVRQYVFEHGKKGDKRVSIFAFYDKGELMEAVVGNGTVELEVVGRLRSGRYFRGWDSVRIRNRHWRRWLRR